MLKWYLLKHPCCLALRILLPWYNINLQLSSANRKPPFPVPHSPPTTHLQRLIRRARIPHPRVPQRNNRVRQHPNTRIPSSAIVLRTINRHAPLYRASKRERIQDEDLLQERARALLLGQHIRLERLVECRSRWVEYLDRRLGTGARLRGDGWIEQEFLRRDARDEDLSRHCDGVLEMCGFERGNVEMADHEQVQAIRLHARPENDNVHAHCQKRVGELDLHAVEQEAVAQRRVGAVLEGARAQQERWDRDGEDLDGGVGEDGERGDFEVCGQEVRVGHVGEDGERCHVVD